MVVKCIDLNGKLLTEQIHKDMKPWLEHCGYTCHIVYLLLKKYVTFFCRYGKFNFFGWPINSALHIFLPLQLYHLSLCWQSSMRPRLKLLVPEPNFTIKAYQYLPASEDIYESSFFMPSKSSYIEQTNDQSAIIGLPDPWHFTKFTVITQSPRWLAQSYWSLTAAELTSSILTFFFLKDLAGALPFN